MIDRSSTPYEANAELSRVEIARQHIHLQSMPRHLTLVLANRCNLDCIHCYQQKNRDNLLLDRAIGGALRRELRAVYPFLETLRIQGGEVFAIRGFAELVDEVGEAVDRPIISISTNGTLIDDEWAERIVRTPFQSITISIDAGTRATYNRVRRGADLDHVLENIERLHRWKRRLRSERPTLDAFFVILRSNFREIPSFLDRMADIDIVNVAFQTLLVDDRNLSREPGLSDEILRAEDVVELHGLLQELLPRERARFDSIALSGLHSLFEGEGLDTSFVDETHRGLYPGRPTGEVQACPDSTIDNGDGAAAVRSVDTLDSSQKMTCPNPWRTVFVSENGDVSLCFVAAPIGNLYEAPITRIWNNQSALAQRSEMLAGRYRSAGCSELYCSWRDGRSSAPTPRDELDLSIEEFRRLVAFARPASVEQVVEISPKLAALRRLSSEQRTRIAELESGIVQAWEKNQAIHDAARRMIDDLEFEVDVNRRLAAQWRTLYEQRWTTKRFTRWRDAARRGHDG